MRIKLLIIMILVTSVYAKSFRVYFVSPHNNDSMFWHSTHNFARASARDLNIEFKIFYSKGRNRYTYIDAVERAFLAKEKPDFIIAVFFETMSKRILELSKEKNIPVFMVNANIPISEKDEIGEVRDKYKNFIGHMFSDEKNAGFILGKYLIKKAKQMYPNKTLEVAGLSGHRDSSITFERNLGLIQAAKSQNAILHQIIYSDWSPDIASKQTKRLVKRYPNINVLWYATDDMALKSKEGLEEISRQNNIVMGGINWRKKAIVALKKGEIDASVGGHFTEVGFSLVLIYDYYHGKDFFNELGKKINTKMILLSKDNINIYYEFLLCQDWEKVDFTRYSKVLNPSLKKYDFSFDTLMEE